MLGINKWAAILIGIALLVVTGTIIWVVVVFLIWWGIRLSADLFWHIKDNN